MVAHLNFVMPSASCSSIISRILCVLMCGRSRSAPPASASVRRRFSSTRSRYTSSPGEGSAPTPSTLNQTGVVTIALFGFRVSVIRTSFGFRISDLELLFLFGEQQIERGQGTVRARDVLLHFDFFAVRELFVRVDLLFQHPEVISDHHDLMKEDFERDLLRG